MIDVIVIEERKIKKKVFDGMKIGIRGAFFICKYLLAFLTPA